MMDYTQVLSEIFAHVDYSRTRQIPYNASTYNLDRMRELCERLGDPQDQFPSLHIAGSKGKGSTAAMTSAILQEAGFRTGLYTSPHLHSFRERLRIDGELITQERLVALWEFAKPVVKALDSVTTFEIITVLAFLYFSQPPVDWAVLEVGLGGRLDATNVIQSQACAITSLSHEHTDLLGHTLSLIAFEKAGVIKPGNPVIVGPQAPEAMAVIESVAEQAGAPLWRVGEVEDARDHTQPLEWRWRLHEADATGLWFDVFGPDIMLEDLHVPLVGFHQAANATVAIALIHRLRTMGVQIPIDAVRAGLGHVVWPGRLERLNLEPLVILDSAHNRQSAERLQRSLQLFPHERLVLLFGASADKDIHGMLDVLAPLATTVIVTRSFHPRAADPHTLAELVDDVAPDVELHVTNDAVPALSLALERAAPHDLILITGSIFVVAAARESWLALHPDGLPEDDWARHAEPIDGDFSPMLRDETQRKTKTA